MNAKIVYPFKVREDFLRDVVGDLVSIRKDRKVTQEELNHMLGVADRLVSKWECGLRTPTAFNLYCWADALDARLKIVANDNDPQPCGLKLQKPANDVVSLAETN